MQIFTVEKDGRPRRLEAVDRLPESGYLWLDFRREEAEGWVDKVKALCGVDVFDAHVTDSFNASHPSFFDITPDYEMLIFQALGPDDDEALIDTRTAAFFLFDRLLVSIHAHDSVSFDIVTRRLETEKNRLPRSPAAMLHMILDTMVDRYLAVRTRFSERASALQDELLDLDSPFSDWRTLLDHRRAARRLGSICDGQWEAVNAWRRGTRAELSNHLEIRYNDLVEHIERVLAYARLQEQETDSAVQLHFSAVAHRTNEIMRTLTVLSAIFLPLSLVAGIFGMNFAFMPELQLKYGYFYALGGMAVLSGVLLLLFKRKGWF